MGNPAPPRPRFYVLEASACSVRDRELGCNWHLVTREEAKALAGFLNELIERLPPPAEDAL